MQTARQKLHAVKVAAAEMRLADALPLGGAWISAARRAAASRLGDMGLPVKRDEYWRFTDPARLTDAKTHSAKVLDTHDEAPMFDGIDSLRLVFTDGRLDIDASDPLALDGVEISTLHDAARHDIHWARDIYGVLEADGQSPVDRPLAALNTAYATDGLMIRVTGKAPRPIALICQRSAVDADAMLHHVIRVAEGGELTLLESGPVAARFNTLMEVDVADGGTLHHIRAQGRDHERVGVTNLFARLGTASVLKSFTLTLNGALIRNEGVVWLNGKGGSVHLAGAVVGDGKFHQDDTLFVTHGAPDCESRQVYKKVLRNGAVGVFQGKILVKQIAQKTDGYQISQSLLLDEASQFLAKPELEIYADDVKCSHGSTSGEINPDHLFYLRARGVSVEDAKALLVLAFLAEALEEIADDAIAEDLRARLESWLKRHRT